MGCMGIIYSYTLLVTPTYFLEETRTESDWGTLRSLLLNHAPGEFPSFVTDSRHCEIYINPYSVNGSHLCIVTTRKEVKGPKSGSRGPANWLAGVIAQLPGAEEVLVTILNWFPKMIPHVLNGGLGTLKDNGYVDKSFKVLDLGAVNREPAWAIELSATPDNLVSCMDQIIQFFDDKRKERRYITGPVAIRFVRAADAYFAPQYGRATCMIEPDMLSGTDHEFELLGDLEKLLLSRADVRVHWGLEIDVLTGAQVSAKYPKYEQWLAVYNELNASGMFNNALTDRLGISR